MQHVKVSHKAMNDLLGWPSNKCAFCPFVLFITKCRNDQFRQALSVPFQIPQRVMPISPSLPHTLSNSSTAHFIASSQSIPHNKSSRSVSMVHDSLHSIRPDWRYGAMPPLTGKFARCHWLFAGIGSKKTFSGKKDMFLS